MLSITEKLLDPKEIVKDLNELAASGKDFVFSGKEQVESGKAQVEAKISIIHHDLKLSALNASESSLKVTSRWAKNLKLNVPKTRIDRVIKIIASRKLALNEPAIKKYDTLTVREIKAKLVDLSVAELMTVRSYEKSHKNRKTLISALSERI